MGKAAQHKNMYLELFLEIANYALNETAKVRQPPMPDENGSLDTQ